MTTSDIKIKIHDEIEHSDERLLKMIYALIREYRDGDSEELSDERMKMVMEEREKYQKGEGKSYSWEEVKGMAIKKQKPDEL